MPEEQTQEQPEVHCRNSGDLFVLDHNIQCDYTHAQQHDHDQVGVRNRKESVAGDLRINHLRALNGETGGYPEDTE